MLYEIIYTVYICTVRIYIHIVCGRFSNTVKICVFLMPWRQWTLAVYKFSVVSIFTSLVIRINVVSSVYRTGSYIKICMPVANPQYRTWSSCTAKNLVVIIFQNPHFIPDIKGKGKFIPLQDRGAQRVPGS